MAKKIEELVVGLNIEGLEKVERLRSAFRELSKVTKLNDTEIRDLRQRLIDYGAEAGNTGRVTKGLEEAFKGLIGEARKGSDVWEQLSRDIAGFRQQARLTDDEIAKLTAGITQETRAHAQSETSIRGHIKALQDLRAQSVLGGQVNRQLGNAIQELTVRLDEATAGSRKHFSALNQALAVRPDAVLNQWQAYTKILRDVRTTAEQAAEAQNRLNRLAGAPRISARREVSARAEIQADPDYVSRFGLGGRSLEEMADVPAALSLRLRELQEDLNYTTRSAGIYVDILVEMARVQREASATTQGFAARLREQLQAGQIAPSQRNLQEVIGALRREMLELDQTTEEGSRQYAENANQANVLERQLKELANSYRTVAEAAGQAATAEQNAANARIRGNYFNRRMMREQEQAFASFADGVRRAAASTPLMLPAAGQTSAAGTGQSISGGARRLTGQVESTFGEPIFRRPRALTGLPSAAVGQPAAVGTTPDAYAAQAAAARAAAADLTQYRAAIDKAAQANNGSINSMQRLRESLVAMRSAIPGTDAEFGKLTRRIQTLDAQIQKTELRRRQPLGAMGATQAAGAIISGGIFGGPEGAIGGAVGTALGGVPGAFAGAAAGAQIGIMRKQLGGMAEFTAEIDKQRIALRNVVGSQEAYNSSLQFIDSTSRRLAIPQDQLNKQFTQLAASVVGAGGNVDAAKVAFEGIAAGIRGTGGSLQDLQGALLATSQVFGKGKVSAEELRQQIGERMPGAFSIFAESIGKTPQELDKMLSKGEVGLNDFMKFVQELSRRYGQSANEIAASSQAAGDRMQVTFARLREAIGRELQPVGAQFQELFARALEDNEQKIIEFAKGIADAAKAIADFLTTAGPAIVELVKLAIQFAAANLAIKAFTALQGPVTTMFLALQNGFTATTAQAAAAQTRMIAFGTTVKAIAASLAAPIIVTVAIIGAGIVIKTLNDIKAARDRLTQESTLPRGEQFIQSIGGSAASYETLVRNANDVAKALDIEERNLKTLRDRAAQRQTSTYSGLNQENKTLKTQIDATEKSITRLKINYRALIDAIPDAKKASQAGLDFSFPGGDVTGAAGDAKAAKGPESRAAELRLELNLRLQMLEAESMIAQARLDGDERLTAMLTTLQAQTRLVTEAAKVELEKIPAQDKALKLRLLEQDAVQENARRSFVFAELEKKASEELKKTMEQISKQVDAFEDRAAFEREYGELIMQGSLPATARQYLETKKVVDETIRAAEAALVKAEADGASADEIERQRKELERIRGAGQEELDRIQGGDDPSKIISSAIIRIQGELNELMNIGNQVVGAANAIGDAFGNSFKGILTGSMTAKEALRNFFSSLADYFADMAAKMIAQWIKLAILNSILKLFPGAGGSGAGLSNLSAPATINNPLGVLNANGNAFAANGIVPYAKGGVVNSPTLFKFAKGGSMATGVMGEAGPEAIMPLKRGADGKLGVQATGGGGVTVNVSVDAKGTQVEGDPGQGQQLGRVIAGAVQAEIIKQQRPGGLLGNTR